MTKKILIAAGGTGGHIFPALTLAERLMDQISDSDVKLIGGGAKKNIPSDFNLDYKTISCAPFSLSQPFKLFPSVIKNFKGFRESRRFIHKFKPDLVVGFGSYYSFPVLLAAKSCQVPFILHEQNSVPGRVNRLMSKYAVLTGVFFPEASKFLKGKSVEVEMPLRHQERVSKFEAFSYFNLNPDKQTLLIFGGSIGALKINEICLNLGKTFDELGLQIIHFTGHSDVTQKLKSYYESLNLPACVKDFETSMSYAWAIADFFIGRAGASTVAEALVYETPGIFIPYPYAMDNHQEKNADFMVQLDGGKKCVQATIHIDEFAKLIKGFSRDHNLGKMKESIQQFKKQRQSQDLCKTIQELI